MDLKVFIATGESVCSECGEELGRHAWITLVEGQGALCLTCADLDQLIFLPSGDAALTRRAGKYSTLSAVVLQWSRARKRYERPGLLVDEAALKRAEHACQKYSGRVGRSVGAKNLDEEFIRLAVIARIRHAETNYDEFLAQSMERKEARSEVQDEVDQVLARWKAV